MTSSLPATAQESQVESLQNQIIELTSVVRDLKAEVQELRATVTAVREMSAPQPTALPDAARMASLEEEQQLLNTRLEEQYQTKVESASKYRMRLSGIVLLNLFNNRGVVDNADFPSLARHRGSLDLSTSFGGSLRQSMLGFEVFGPRIRGARVDADAQFDFAGTGSANSYDTPIGLLRLRTGVVRMTWPKTTIAAGQDAPFFSPLSPTSVASLALPAFSYSGNLWSWQPQVRLEHSFDLSGGRSVLLQGGILSPLWSRQPAYAMRSAWNQSVFGRSLTVGAAGYYSRQDWGFQRIVDSWLSSFDWNIPLNPRWDLSGEIYRGRAIGQLGGGIDQTILTNGPLSDPATRVRGLNSTGGWTQLKFRATERLEWNAAIGQDNPFANQHPPVARNRNALLNFIYRPRSDVLLSGEYRLMQTFTPRQASDRAHQISVSMGVLF
jgi:hypothetical protein